jgi:hypothetical protein
MAGDELVLHSRVMQMDLVRYLTGLGANPVYHAMIGIV